MMGPNENQAFNRSKGIFHTVTDRIKNKIFLRVRDFNTVTRIVDSNERGGGRESSDIISNVLKNHKFCSLYG